MGACIILVHEDPVFLEVLASAMRLSGHTVTTLDCRARMVQARRALNEIEITAIQVKGVRAGIQFTLTSLPKKQPYVGMFSNFVPEPVSAAEAVNTLRCFLPVQPMRAANADLSGLT
jgi:hypothetical protein